MSPQKMVYSFGDGKADGDESMKNLLGGKGANLAEMVSLGVPVPAGFTITTELCTYYYKNKKRHRFTCAGADGDEERVLRVAKFRVHVALNLFKRFLDFGLQSLGVFLLALIVVRADLGRNREARGHGNA